jgi:hypothetical protein
MVLHNFLVRCFGVQYVRRSSDPLAIELLQRGSRIMYHEHSYLRSLIRRGLAKNTCMLRDDAHPRYSGREAVGGKVSIAQHRGERRSGEGLDSCSCDGLRVHVR